MESDNSNRSRSDSDFAHESDNDIDYVQSRTNKRGRGRGRVRRVLNSSLAGAGDCGVRRGRRRGGRGAQGSNRLELAVQARRERSSCGGRYNTYIASMDTESLRDAVKLVCSKQPSFILDIMHSIQDENPDNPHPTSSSTAPSWCICSHCREMPLDREKVCCNNSSQNCHSTLPDFQTVVLDELVLEVAMRYHNDILAEPRDDNFNRSRRHTAYRQYIMWIHGRLGAGNRKVIPSCCIWKIRDKYPDPYGQYVGFLEGVLGN